VDLAADRGRGGARVRALWARMAMTWLSVLLTVGLLGTGISVLLSLVLWQRQQRLCWRLDAVDARLDARDATPTTEVGPSPGVYVLGDAEQAEVERQQMRASDARAAGIAARRPIGRPRWRK